MTRDTSAVGALSALSWRGWVVLRELSLPGKRRGPLDHVLVGPGGVFVVARTKWPGPVSVTSSGLQLGGRSRSRDVSDVAAAAAGVLALVPDVPVHPVLCLERHAPVTGWSSNVMLCATSNVEELLTGRPAVLGPEQVQEVADVLKARLLPAPPAPEAEPAPGVRRVVPWPIRVLLQALTLALAALLVIGVLQTRVVDEISAAVDDFVTEVSTVDEAPNRKARPVPETSSTQQSAPEQSRPEQTRPRTVPGKVLHERVDRTRAKDNKKQRSQRERERRTPDRDKASRRRG